LNEHLSKCISNKEPTLSRKRKRSEIKQGRTEGVLYTVCTACEEGVNFKEFICPHCYLLSPQLLSPDTKCYILDKRVVGPSKGIGGYNGMLQTKIMETAQGVMDSKYKPKKIPSSKGK